ncbi:MAG TPA: DUF3667 domain-containing protein [Gemmatimonadaceae bacterium]
MASPPSPREAPPVPIEESGASSFGRCGNCGAQRSGPFCSQCGEKNVSAKDYSLSHVVEETLAEFAHFDSKFLRTLKLLFTQPGQLSNAFFHGGRSRYTKPLTLFIIINVIFFIVQPHTGLLHYKFGHYMNDAGHSAAVLEHLRQTGEPVKSYEARFNANLQNQKKSLLIVSVPVLALFMTIVFAGSGRTYAEHLIFSVEVYAFLLSYIAAVVVLLFTPITMLLRATGPVADPIRRVLEHDLGITVFVIIGVTVYMYLGFRRAYDVSRFRAASSALILPWVVAYLTGVYHAALFYITFWTT